MVTIQTAIKAFWIAPVTIQNNYQTGYYSSTALVTVHEQYPHSAAYNKDKRQVTIHEQ